MDKCHRNPANTATTLAQRLTSRDTYDLDLVVWLDESTGKGAMDIQVEVAIIKIKLVRGACFQVFHSWSFDPLAAKMKSMSKSGMSLAYSNLLV